MRPTAALALACLLLAGCSQDKAAPAPIPSDGTTDASMDGAAFDLTGCVGPILVAEVPRESVQAHLPPGYVAQGNLLNNPHLQGLQCDDVAVGDAHYAGLDLAFAGTLLFSAAGHEEEAGAEFYMFELFLDVEAAPALAEALSSAGWAVLDADVQVSRTSVTVASEGIAYSFSALDDPGPIDFDAGAERFHRAEPALVLRFEQQLLGQYVGASALRAQGGVLGALAGETGVLPGATQQVGFEGHAVVQPATPAA